LNKADFATAKSALLFSGVISSSYWYFIDYSEMVESMDSCEYTLEG
jgi:hypothetical protein